MPALVAGIHVLDSVIEKTLDGRNKSGHDVAIHPCLVCSTAAVEMRDQFETLSRNAT